MEAIEMRVTCVNRTEGYRYADLLDTLEELPTFTDLRADFGRCEGRVYIDTKTEDAIPIGYVFAKRERYDDGSGEFTCERWVTFTRVTRENVVF